MHVHAHLHSLNFYVLETAMIQRIMLFIIYSTQSPNQMYATVIECIFSCC